MAGRCNNYSDQDLLINRKWLDHWIAIIKLENTSFQTHGIPRVNSYQCSSENPRSDSEAQMQSCGSFVRGKCELGHHAEERETDRNEVLNQIFDYGVI